MEFCFCFRLVNFFIWIVVKFFFVFKEVGRGRELRKILGEILFRKEFFFREVLVWGLGFFLAER